MNTVLYTISTHIKVIRIVLGVLLSVLPKPTMVLLSGRGLTFVYRYDHLLQGEEITLHDAVYRALIEKVQKLFDPSIVEVDAHVTDHARVCRLAGTKNVKAGRTNRTFAYLYRNTLRTGKTVFPVWTV